MPEAEWFAPFKPGMTAPDHERNWTSLEQFLNSSGTLVIWVGVGTAEAAVGGVPLWSPVRASILRARVTVAGEPNSGPCICDVLLNATSIFTLGSEPEVVEGERLGEWVTPTISEWPIDTPMTVDVLEPGGAVHVVLQIEVSIGIY